MGLHQFALFLHLLGAGVWVGGHLVLALSVLPEAMRGKNPEPVRVFEQVYERIGLPAMALQVVSGLWLAFSVRPEVSQWMNWSDPISRTILLKLILLAVTIMLALHARLTIIPRLNAARLPLLAAHIIAVTVIAVCFVWLGVAFRYGGF